MVSHHCLHNTTTFYNKILYSNKIILFLVIKMNVIYGYRVNILLFKTIMSLAYNKT